jgi:hypothetical protein
MSKKDDVMRRLTGGNSLPQETERHDITLRPAKDGDPPGLIRKVAETVKKRIPKVVDAGLDYVEAQGKGAQARANEIQAKAIGEIRHVENETQELIDQREAKRREAANEAQRDQNTHDREQRKLELEELRIVCDCIAELAERGIAVGVTVKREVERRMARHLKRK